MQIRIRSPWTYVEQKYDQCSNETTTRSETETRSEEEKTEVDLVPAGSVGGLRIGEY